jgi:UrcA family protein
VCDAADPRSVGSSNQSRTLLSLTCAAGLLLAGAASAQGAGRKLSVSNVEDVAQAQAISASVAYADLNLATSAGQAEFNRRVRSAARRLCRRLHPDVWKDNLAHACEQQAIHEALATEQAIVARAAVRSYAAAARR